MNPPGPPPGQPPVRGGMVPPGPPPGGPPGPPPGGPPGMPLQMQGFPGMFVPPPGMLAPPMAPHTMPNFAPAALPPGWTEHRAPDGVTPYFYNAHTRESTYVRPVAPMGFPAYPPPPPSMMMSSGPNGSLPHASSSTAAAPEAKPSAEQQKKKKKEKPKNKVPIPGTTWTRVTTTEGNVFYFEKESKVSEWTVPESIQAEVAALEAEEKVERQRLEAEEKAKAEAERLERLKEQERVRLEVEEEARKRKEAATAAAQASAEEQRKRKQADEAEQSDRDVKAPKLGGGVENDADAAEHGEYGPQDEEDEEAWMKAVAAEFAEADQKEKEDEVQRQKDEKNSIEEAAQKIFAVPNKVSVSPEEGRALFKALLIEKDISPFAPWDQSLPLFINDPRYVLLPSQKDRQEVYDEYCRDVGRQRRLKKGSTSASAGGSNGRSGKADPERDYKALLREEVTSTRTRWDEWRRKWKKDRRFYSFGRDDREREKVFKTHLKELSERKRADAHRAEQDFFELLKEAEPAITSTSIWSEVKRPLTSDPRYDAVGSSSLREELFNTYVRKLASSSSLHKKDETPEEAAERKLRERKEKEAASLRARQQKVGAEQEKVQSEVEKGRRGAGREEGERLFGSLLVDQIRDEMSWNEAAQTLQNDSRFNHPALSLGDKRRTFEAHMTRISSKRSGALHTLFSTHTPALDTPFSDVYPHIVDDPMVTRLGLNSDLEALEARWKAWHRSWEAQARAEFDTMLGENSFVEFWGRMRKKVLDEQALKANKAEMEEMEEGEGIGDGGGADLTGMAKQIDLNEIKAVLRRDKRYRIYDHIPEQREQWLRDYLENLEAASGSSTVHNVGQNW